MKQNLLFFILKIYKTQRYFECAKNVIKETQYIF